MAESVVAPVVAPVVGTPEYDAAMIAKFDSTQPAQPAPATPIKPEHVPEKFWNATTGAVNYESWAKSTTEAERKITELAGAKPPVATPAPAPVVVAPGAAAIAAHANLKAALEQKVTDLTAAGATADEINAAKTALAQHPATPVVVAAAAVLESKGLDMSEFTTEFTKDGALSEASMAKLAAAGIDKATVDNYINGQQALSEQTRSKAFALIGGEENYGKMADWAKAGQTPAEIAAFNASLAGSTEQAHLAITGMYQKYIAANGQDPALLNGGTTGTNSGFASVKEMTTMMKDKRYESDPAFRAAVEKRVAATTAF